MAPEIGDIAKIKRFYYVAREGKSRSSTPTSRRKTPAFRNCCEAKVTLVWRHVKSYRRYAGEAADSRLKYWLSRHALPTDKRVYFDEGDLI